MSFVFNCPNCNKAFQAEDTWDGWEKTCPFCRKQIIIQRRRKRNYNNRDFKRFSLNDFVPFEEKIRSKQWYIDFINNLDCNTNVKNALKALLDITVECGKKILHIGRIAVHIAMSVAQKYPQTFTGTVLVFVISHLIRNNYILGKILGPFLPLFVIVPAFREFLPDLKQIKSSVEDLLKAR